MNSSRDVSSGSAAATQRAESTLIGSAPPLTVGIISTSQSVVQTRNVSTMAVLSARSHGSRADGATSELHDRATEAELLRALTAEHVHEPVADAVRRRSWRDRLTRRR